MRRTITFTILLAFIIGGIFSNFAVADVPSFSINNPVELTAEEKEWLNEGHKVRIAIGDYPPYIMYSEENGTIDVQGISIEYIETIFNYHNIKYEYVPTADDSFSQLMDQIGEKQNIDMMPAIRCIDNELELIAVTKPYIEAPLVIFTRDDAGFISSINDLSGSVVAVPADYSVYYLIKENYPEIILKIVDDPVVPSKICLEMVESGEVDAFVGNLIVASYIISDNKMNSIKVAAPTPFEMRRSSMAVRSDWSELAGIIDKSIAAFDEQQHAAIRAKWFDFQHERGVSWWQVILIVIAASSIFIVIILIINRINKRLQKEIEYRKAIDESNKIRLAQAVSSANIGMWNYYPENNYIEVNEIWCRQLGYEPSELRHGEGEWSELIGGTNKWVELMHPDDRTRILQILGDYLQGILGEYKEEFRLKSKNGEYRWMLGAGSKTKVSTSGVVKQMTGVHILIDEIKFAQQQTELAKEEAEKALKVKSEFLANMSHEIRTPMNAVIGFNDLLLNTRLTKKQKNYVSQIDTSSKKLLKVINEILDFSKLESGKLKIEETEFCLDEVLSALTSGIAYRAFDKKLELLIFRDPNIPDTLMGDPFRLGQVLLNLCDNAIKFTEEGEIFVNIDLIEINNNAKIRFSVQDTGIGMTNEQIGNLFIAFQQADTSTTRKYGGTGLGLAICQNIVQMMGSTIDVVSEYGKGTKFSFIIDFPLCEINDESSSLIYEKVRKLKILAADDNARMREILKVYFSDLDNEACIVESGIEAVKQIKEADFDVVILDCQMPELDGVETWLQMQKCDNFDINTKSILQCPAGLNQIEPKAQAASFDAIIPKQFTKREVYKTILDVYFDNYDNSDSCPNNVKYPAGFELIKGARILLAEDDEINQQVAKEILEYEGFFVDIAGNGAIVVDMVTKSEYDVVLMDLQMPVVDGYLASKVLRARGYNDLPIIALSADVMNDVKSNVEKYQLNDYISKPIDKVELFYKLVKWIKPAVRAINKGDTTYEQKINSDLMLEVMKDVDALEGLRRTDNNINLYMDLLGRYALNYGDFFDELSDSINNNDFEMAKKHVHKLKGVALNIGINKVAEVLIDLENCLKNNEVEKLGELILTGRKIHNKVISQINKLSADTKDEEIADTEGVKEISDTEFLDKLKDLYNHIYMASAYSIDICEEILTYKFTYKVRNDIIAINNHLAKFDFDEALEINKKLINMLE